MGVADVVPGVSGGTIAFITGIYQRLINALATCTPASLIVWRKKGFKAFTQKTDLYFLLILFTSIAVAAKLFAGIVIYALLHHTQFVWAFFSGLILATVWFLLKMLGRPRPQEMIALVLGAALVFYIARYLSADLPASPIVFFCSGFVAICAMILPGVSGSAILLVIGVYPDFLRAIDDTDLAMIASFLAGCIAGLMTFSRLLRYVFKRFYRTTIATITGLLIGSLYVTWPFKYLGSDTTINSLSSAKNMNILDVINSGLAVTDSLMILLATAVGFMTIVLSERFS